MAMATQINATQEQLPGTSQPGEEAAAPKGEVLLMLPDKLPATKVSGWAAGGGQGESAWRRRQLHPRN